MAEIISRWSDIDWINVNNNVKRLRQRIFKASLDNNFRKLRALQRLMLKSKSNMLIAIRDISSNSGGKTYGVDGETLRFSEDRMRIFREISSLGYLCREPRPARRIYIKEPTKLRPIGIPTVFDRVIQSMVLNSLEPEWESRFEKGSYGFRPKRTVDDAVNRVWVSLSRKGGRKWIVDSDIAKCFDSISHRYIMKKIEGFPAADIIRKWLKAGIITKDVWFDSGEEGTPQGSAISPLLCNITLHGLEEELGIEYNKRGFIQSNSRTLIRFADDLVILCHSKEDALLALELLKEALRKRGLEISITKTKIVHITEGFEFLGYKFKLEPKRHISLKYCLSVDENENIRIKQEKMGLYVKPSQKSIKKVKKKLKEVFSMKSSSMTKNLINKANEIIRGFAQSKWHWHSSSAFRHLDYYLYILCIRWINRRHPKQNTHWKVKNYFTELDFGNVKSKWVFHSKNSTSNTKKMHETYMYKFHWFRIKSHILAQMNRVPDNRSDVSYYDDLRVKRLQCKPFNVLFRLDKDLAESQGGICPICKEELFNGEMVNIHHIIPKSEGGKFTFENLVILHYHCHVQIHNDEYSKYYKNFLYNYRQNHCRVNHKKKQQ